MIDSYTLFSYHIHYSIIFINSIQLSLYLIVIDSHTLYTYHITSLLSILFNNHSISLWLTVIRSIHIISHHYHQFYSIITLSHCNWHSYALFISQSLFYHITSIITLFHYDWHSYALFISQSLLSILFNNQSISLWLTLIRSFHITSIIFINSIQLSIYLIVIDSYTLFSYHIIFINPFQ